MMKSYPKVFIVILNYNGKGVTENCLRSLYKINYSNFEIVVVDNNSIDGSLEDLKQKFSKISFIKNEENIGFSGGNNIGIRFALERMADYVLLLNNDTEVAPGFLTKLVEVATSHLEIGIMSPVVMKQNSSQIWFSGGTIGWLTMKNKHWSEIREDLFYSSEFISGCAMFIKKDVFQSIGLLDEDLFIYYEDADFSLRAKKAGYSLAVVPQSRVLHFEKSEEKKANKVYWLVLSGLIFFHKNSPWWLKSWHFIYIFLRRIKNYRDVKNHPGEINLAVQKAYQDFIRYAK